MIGVLLSDLAHQIDVAPDEPMLDRLSPPAYAEDPELDAGYQLLAGEELRSSRLASIRAVEATIDAEDLDETELWAWLQALNALRLVVGTRLDITDDDHGPDERVLDNDEDATLWAIYDFTTQLQYDAVQALGS